jgi:hypothetical protein
MDFKSFGPEQQRRLLELSFEPQGDGYLYYQNRWARGVPVTVDERECYLAAGALASRSVFYRAIRGRVATAPPRKYGPVYWQILSRMPLAMGGSALFAGLALASSGFSAAPLFGRVLLLTIGIALAAFGAQIIYARVAVQSQK